MNIAEKKNKTLLKRRKRAIVLFAVLIVALGQWRNTSRYLPAS